MKLNWIIPPFSPPRDSFFGAVIVICPLSVLEHCLSKLYVNPNSVNGFGEDGVYSQGYNSVPL